MASNEPRWIVKLGSFVVDTGGVRVDTRWGRILLTSSTEDGMPGDSRYLFLLRDDFRTVLLRLPWTRELWPRRRLG